MAETAVIDGRTLISGVLPDHVINSQETFDWVTGSPHEVAGLYFYQELDELIELARAISFVTALEMSFQTGSSSG